MNRGDAPSAPASMTMTPNNNMGNGLDAHQKNGNLVEVGTHDIRVVQPGCPWLVPGKVYDKGILGLHQEVEDFYNWMSPSEEEHHLRLVVIEKIRNFIRDLWPEAHVELIGSFRTGFYLPTSEIDLVVIGKWENLPLYTLHQALLDNSIAERATQDELLLNKVTVPIIKLTDKQTDIKINIIFNMIHGIKAAELIKTFRTKFPVLGKLIFVLKQFLLQRHLNQAFNDYGVTSFSYSLILMTVSFLQLHPRKDAGAMNANLGVLLIEFFELYGQHFNYLKTGIRVRNGGGYFPKEDVRTELVGERSSFLCIEDPLTTLTPGNNTIHGSDITLRLKLAFKNAFISLSQAVNILNDQLCDPNVHSILGRIISIQDDVVDYRAWTRNMFSYHASTNSSTSSSTNSSADLLTEPPPNEAVRQTMQKHQDKDKGQASATTTTYSETEKFKQTIQGTSKPVVTTPSNQNTQNQQTHSKSQLQKPYVGVGRGQLISVINSLLDASSSLPSKF